MIRSCLCIVCCVFCAVCGCSHKEDPAPATTTAINIQIKAPAPAAKTVAIAKPAPASGKAASGKQAAKPAANEHRSRIVRALLDTLGELKDKGTPEEMRLVQKILRQADEELSNSLGKNSRRKILEANNKPGTFQVRRRKVIASAEKKQAGPNEKSDDQASKKSPDQKK